MAVSGATYEEQVSAHVQQSMAAVRLQGVVGSLLYEKGVELVFLREHLVNRDLPSILKLHQYSLTVGRSVGVETTSRMATELAKVPLAPSKIDIARLAREFIDAQPALEAKIAEPAAAEAMLAFLKAKLEGFCPTQVPAISPRDVVLYGFGRIGRLAARELIRQAGKGDQLRLRAVVTRSCSESDLVKRGALMQNDSVHGHFEGTVGVDVDSMSIILSGQQVRMIVSSAPEAIDYTQYGINDALVIDNTGAFTDREALSRHLKAKGCKQVLLTAPGKGCPNVVYGVNQDELDLNNETVFSAASCTTNAIVPVLKVINDTFKVVKGHIETIHAYTNDQNLLDNFHKKPRRGRSAAINMVITSTGAGTAVTKVIPALKDKLTANAVRVPTPNGSLAVLNLEVDTTTSVDAVNEAMKAAALDGRLVNQIYFSTDPELVSTDIVGNTCCSVFDSKATIAAKDGRNIVLYVWYDNEFGYTKQVLRLAKYIAKVGRKLYY